MSQVVASVDANRPCFLWLRGENTAANFKGGKQGFFAQAGIYLERFMKAGLAALAVIAIVAATTAPAEARRHHRDSHYGCHLYDDYTHSNALSAYSYIYPAANWGPFFRCRMYYSPVVTAPTAPYPYPY